MSNPYSPLIQNANLPLKGRSPLGVYFNTQVDPNVGKSDLMNELVEKHMATLPQAKEQSSKVSPDMPIQDLKNSIASDTVTSSQPIQQPSYLDKLNSLEQEFKKPIVAQKPTNLADVFGSIGQTLGGGKETEPGKRDFIGSLMSTLGSIGNYAASGQGQTLLGAALKNKALMGSGLEQLNKEQGYQAEADKQNFANKKELLPIYKSQAVIEGLIGNHQNFKDFAYLGSDGKYHQGQMNKTTGQRIIDEETDPIVKQPGNTVFDFMGKDGLYHKGVYNQTTKQFETSTNSPLGHQNPQQHYIDPNTGQEAVFNPTTGGSYVKPTPPNQGWTPSQRTGLTDQEKALRSDPEFKRSAETLNSAKNVEALLNKKGGMQEVKVSMRALAADKTRAANLLQAYGGSPDAVNQVRQSITTATSGTFTPENQQILRNIAQDYVKNAKQNRNDLIDRETNSYISKYGDANPEQVRKHFANFGASGATSQSPGKSQKVRVYNPKTGRLE